MQLSRAAKCYANPRQVLLQPNVNIPAVQTNKMLYLVYRTTATATSAAATTTQPEALVFPLSNSLATVRLFSSASLVLLEPGPLIASHFISPCHVLCSALAAVAISSISAKISDYLRGTYLYLYPYRCICTCISVYMYLCVCICVFVSAAAVSKLQLFH